MGEWNEDAMREVMEQANKIALEARENKSRVNSFKSPVRDEVENDCSDDDTIGIALRTMEIISYSSEDTFREEFDHNISDPNSKYSKYIFIGSKGTVATKGTHLNSRKYEQNLMIYHVKDQNKLVITNNSSIDLKIDVDPVTLMDTIKDIVHPIYVDMTVKPLTEFAYPELYTENNTLKVRFYSMDEYKNCLYGTESYGNFKTITDTDFLYIRYFDIICGIYATLSRLMTLLALMEDDPSTDIKPHYIKFDEWASSNNFYAIRPILHRITGK